MKKLVIVRHAKAEDLYNGISDYQRKLTDKGKKNALKVCEQLIDNQIFPNILISSYANRALETAQIYAKEYNIHESDILIDNIIYDAFNVKELKNILNKIDNKCDVVFIFGHNPDLSEILSYFIEDINEYLPKASASIIDFDVEYWNDIDSKNAKLIDIKYAKK